MKIIHLFYFTIVISLTTISCVSYEVSVSHSKKNKSDRWVYNTNKKSTISGSVSTSKKLSNNLPASSEIRMVLNEAEKYQGAPYKLGGTTYSGIDCSGLVYVSFQKINKSLPRRSTDMSTQGMAVSLSNVKKGDLLFFATSGGTNINHVGIVYEINGSGEISFIHASTSKGVMISSMEEKYWKGKFIKARRVI